MYTVLLIEDQLDVASVMRLMLSRGGYRALLASNLAEANQIWAAFKDEIHLVLTDNHLPDGSGVEFAAGLVREKPSLKVAVASGNPDPDIPSGFYRIDKPFLVTTLLNTLRIALSTND